LRVKIDEGGVRAFEKKRMMEKKFQSSDGTVKKELR